MSNVWLLIKNYILQFIGGIVNKRHQTKTIIAFGICVIISLGVIGLFGISSYSVTKEYFDLHYQNPEINFDQMALYTNCVMMIMLLMLLMVTRSVFPSKDRDFELLYSMPIRKVEITFAKLIFDYLFDLSTIITFIYPSIVAYSFFVKDHQIAILIRGLALVLIIPMVTNTYSVFIGYLFERIARRFRYYSVIQSGLIIILITIYLVVNYQMTSVSQQSEVFDLNKTPVIIRVITEFLLYGYWKQFSIVLIMVIIPLGISIWFRSLILGKNYQRQINYQKQISYKPEKVLKSLYLKELKMYFSTSVYIINTIIGAVFYWGMLLMMNLKTRVFIEEYINRFTPSFANYIGAVILMMVTLMISTVVTTTSAISLEGNCLWILKVHPIDPKTVFLSKILLNVTITTGSIIVSFPLLLGIFEKVGSTLLIMITLILSTINSSILGLMVNLNYPKMEWTSEDEPVKRSLSSLLGLLVITVATFIPFLIFFTIALQITIMNWWLIVILLGYHLLMILGGYRYLATRGVKLFEQIR